MLPPFLWNTCWRSLGRIYMLYILTMDFRLWVPCKNMFTCFPEKLDVSHDYILTKESIASQYFALAINL